MQESMVLIEQKEAFYLITINRPEALNALNKGVFDQLEAFFGNHKNDFSIKGVVITGAGSKAFVAGADIKEFAALDEDEGAALSKRGQDVFFLIENFHAPVIAAVNGFALGGGCELAMACHMRIASSTAKFGQPEVNLGLVPGYGGSQRLVQLAGKGKALEMLLTGAMIDAQEAWRTGIVNYVTEPGNEVAKSFEILGIIAKKAPLAVAGCISLANDYYTPSVNGYQEEYTLFGKLITTDDAREGAAAFVEKRTAEFKAR
jgi:enoyl-CoA hydratase